MAFDKDVGQALKSAYGHDYDNEAVYLTKVAEIIPRDIFSRSQNFNGIFEEGCQEKSIPESLLESAKIILNGPNIETQSRTSKSTL